MAALFSAAARRVLTVQQLAIRSSSLTAVASQQVRCMGAHHLPVHAPGKREPDNIYRRPDVLPPGGPLSEDDELTWNDSQAPEPLFDQFDIDSGTAFKQFLIAFAAIGAIGVLNLIWRWEPNQPVIDTVFPFNSLRLERGGVLGAKSSEGERVNFFSKVKGIDLIEVAAEPAEEEE